VAKGVKRGETKKKSCTSKRSKKSYVKPREESKRPSRSRAKPRTTKGKIKSRRRKLRSKPMVRNSMEVRTI